MSLEELLLVRGTVARGDVKEGAAAVGGRSLLPEEQVHDPLTEEVHIKEQLQCHAQKECVAVKPAILSVWGETIILVRVRD